MSLNATNFARVRTRFYGGKTRKSQPERLALHETAALLASGTGGGGGAAQQPVSAGARRAQRLTARCVRHRYFGHLCRGQAVGARRPEGRGRGGAGRMFEPPRRLCVAGTWALDGLNEMWRVCKYTSGG